MSNAMPSGAPPSAQGGLSARGKAGFRILQIGLVGGLLAVLLWSSRPTESVPDPLPIQGQLSAFSLTEASGDELTLADLSGNVWIADFIFTRCGGQCLDLTKRMRELQEALTADANVRFVSVTVDPAYDTPERLSDYAGRHKADRSRWYFVTGTHDVLYDLTRNGFKVGSQESSEEEREKGADLFLHSSRFVLVDGQGQIRGYYSSNDSADLHRLLADTRRLARGPAA